MGSWSTAANVYDDFQQHVPTGSQNNNTAVYLGNGSSSALSSSLLGQTSASSKF